jgi:hypothetical protein
MDSSFLKPVIVCYTGGTAGDIVSQIIDDRELSNDRQRLKKPHLFLSNEEKDQYINNSTWGSLPSHDFEYHRERQHIILGIHCRDMESAMWAATRFKAMHRPHVWEEMSRACGATSIEQYAQMIIDFGNMVASYTHNMLYLDRIIAGYAITDLTNLNIPTPGKQLYTEWLVNETGNNSNQRRSQHQN